MIDFLNLGSDEKSTLAGSEFQTFTIRSVKKVRRFRFSYCALYSLHGCLLVGNDVKVKYLLTLRHQSKNDFITVNSTVIGAVLSWVNQDEQVERHTLSVLGHAIS